MKTFCNEVLAFLESEYSDGYDFKIEYTNSYDYGPQVKLFCKYSDRFMLKLDASRMNWIYNFYRSKQIDENRSQLRWQTALIDIIEGS